MALTKGSVSFGADAPPVVPDASSGPNDGSAKAIYGEPPAATRKPRIAGISAEASAASQGDGASSSTGPAFIDGGSVSGFTSLGGVKSAGTPTMP